ncbi:MAG: hypothetical protein ACKODX_01745 [Gemmata sp.]
MRDARVALGVGAAAKQGSPIATKFALLSMVLAGSVLAAAGLRNIELVTLGAVALEGASRRARLVRANSAPGSASPRPAARVDRRERGQAAHAAVRLRLNRPRIGATIAVLC